MAALVTMTFLSLVSYTAASSWIVPQFYTPTYRHIQCNESLSEEETVFLPRKIDCQFKIEVPSGKTLVAQLYHLRKKPIKCHKISVIDDATGKMQNLCGPFNGTSRSYTIKVKNNRQRLSLSFVFINNHFECPGESDMMRNNIPFSISTESENAKVNCTVRFIHRGYLKLKLKKNRTGAASSEECANTVYVVQGTHQNYMDPPSEKKCLSEKEYTRFYIERQMTYAVIAGPPVELEGFFEQAPPFAWMLEPQTA